MSTNQLRKVAGRVLERTRAVGSRILAGARAHPFLLACVAYLVVKQMAVIWTFRGKPEAPPNMLFSLTGAALLAIPWAFALRGRARLVALAVVDVAFGLMLLGDLAYFRQFADLPSVASLRYAGLMTDVHGAVTALLQPTDLLLFAGPVILALLAWKRGPWLAAQPRLRWRRAAVLFCCGAGLLLAVISTAKRLHKPFGGHTAAASRVGPLGYHLHDAGTLLLRAAHRQFGLHEEALATARTYFADRTEGNRPADLAGIAAGRNVIVVQLESWQKFVTETKVGGEEVTPHFNALARESIHLTRLHSQSAQGTTSDAELAMQCSLYPRREGSAYYENATNDLRCLPEILREQGYTTAVMHPNRPDFWNRAAMYRTIGIDTFYDERAFSPEPQIGLGLSDEKFLDEAVDKLAAMPEPFYAMVITITSHSPFDFPGLPRSLQHDPAWAGTRMAHYFDAVHFTDRALGQFVERLRREGILDRSILVVYGDHAGVTRGSSNVADVLPLAPRDQPRWFLTDRQVPALIRLPGGAGATRLDKVSGQIDFAPTIASLLGLSTEGTAFFGRNLLSDEPGFMALVNGATATDDLLYLPSYHGISGCWSLPEVERLPDNRCDALAERARRELDVARDVLETDLVGEIVKARTNRALGVRSTGAGRPRG